MTTPHRPARRPRKRAASESVSDIAGALSAGVRGPHNPDQLLVRRPAAEALRALLAALAGADLVVLLAIANLSWWGWSAASEALRIHYVGALGVIAGFCAVLAVAAFAMPTIGRVEASAGPGRIRLGEGAP
jgi:hypothetical protein